MFDQQKTPGTSNRQKRHTATPSYSSSSGLPNAYTELRLLDPATKQVYKSPAYYERLPVIQPQKKANKILPKSPHPATNKTNPTPKML
jgi:hypothetical protein